jgi:outer membrane receptor for ferrienterochelin and colicin
MMRTAAHIFIIMMFSILASGQTATINSDFERLIENLCKTYQVKIAYSASLVEAQVNADIGNIEGQPITDVLDQVLSGQGLTYRVVDNNKILVRAADYAEKYEEKNELITGRITDAASGFPLPYASVYLSDNSRGTMTDLEGRFSFIVEPSSTQEVVISYLGYQKKRMKCNKLNVHNEISLKVQDEVLDEVMIVVDPILISEIGKNNKTSVNAGRLSFISASEIYGADLLRSIQMMPGVSNDSDSGGELKMRGSDAEETLIMMDGIPLYKTDHYYGIFSSINPYYIDNITLYRNKIPLQYENRGGGMLLLESEDDIHTVEGRLEADFMKINGYLELPVTKNIGLVLGSRFNHTDPFNSPLSGQSQNIDLDNALIDNLNFQRSKLLETNPTFNFKDVNVKLNIDVTPRLKISWAGFASEDVYDRTYVNSFLVRRINRIEVFNEESFINTEDWVNRGSNLSGSYAFDNDKLLKWSFYSSEYKNNYRLGMGISLKAQLQEKEIFSYDNFNYNKIRTEGIRLEYEQQDNWFLGVNIQDRGNAILFEENSETFFERSQSSGELALFGKKMWDISTKFNVGLGLRMNYTESSDTLNVSPLAELFYTPNRNFYFKTSYARLFQTFRELAFESRFGHMQQYFVIAEKGLYPQGRSDLVMIGGGFTKAPWKIDVEFFSKKLDGAIGFLPSKPGINNQDILPNIKSLYRLYVGETRSRGMDFYVGYDVDKFFSQLAYTYSKTEDTFKEIFKGNPFPSQNDRRHQLKWFNAFTFGNFTVSSNMIYNSGKPYISFDLLDEAQTREGIDLDKALLQLPYYLRMDIAVRYDFKLKDFNFYLKGSVYNVTNRENVKYYQQTFAIPISADRLNNFIVGSQSSLVERLFNITAGVSF